MNNVADKQNQITKTAYLFFIKQDKLQERNRPVPIHNKRLNLVHMSWDVLHDCY